MQTTVPAALEECAEDDFLGQKDPWRGARPSGTIIDNLKSSKLQFAAAQPLRHQVS